MTEDKRYCKHCRALIERPLLMISPVKRRPDDTGGDGERVVIAARLKCTCSEDMRADNEVNAADLSNLKPAIRSLIFEKITSCKNTIPVIDPSRINDCKCVMFMTGYDKRKISNWMSLDLLAVEQFYSYIEQNIITVEEIRI